MSIQETIKAEVGLIRRLMGNGGKWLLIANSYFLAALSTFVIVLFVSVCTPPNDYSPLRNESPQHVQNPVTDTDGPLIVDAVKCNSANEDLGVEGTIYVYDVGTRQRYILNTGAGVRPPGCTDYHYENALPNLPPGRYRLEGIEITRDGDRVQQEPFYSEEFVVEGDSE